MRSIALYLIRFYQKFLSRLNGPSACRFSPRCSEYTYQAIDKYGILHGSLLGLKRIFRCHPWSSGGYDPVPQKLD